MKVVMRDDCTCKVCGGELEYIYKPTQQENVMSTYPIEVNGEGRELMCCLDCGLVYAKRYEVID